MIVRSKRIRRRYLGLAAGACSIDFVLDWVIRAGAVRRRTQREINSRVIAASRNRYGKLPSGRLTTVQGSDVRIGAAASCKRLLSRDDIKPENISEHCRAYESGSGDWALRLPRRKNKLSVFCHSAYRGRQTRCIMDLVDCVAGPDIETPGSRSEAALVPISVSRQPDAALR